MLVLFLLYGMGIQNIYKKNNSVNWVHYLRCKGSFERIAYALLAMFMIFLNIIPPRIKSERREISVIFRMCCQKMCMENH